jgi:hypothetical protein
MLTHDRQGGETPGIRRPALDDGPSHVDQAELLVDDVSLRVGPQGRESDQRAGHHNQVTQSFGRAWLASRTALHVRATLHTCWPSE